MTILCATDLLSRSDAPMERAGMLADEWQAPLSLLHVVPPLPDEAALMDELRLAGLQLKARSRRPRWTFESRPNLVVRTGEPAAVVLQTAADLSANLVVMGAHKRRSLREALKGSVAERLAESRRYPMLIVRQKPHRTYRNVLFALDLSEASGAAVRCAETMGLFTDASRCTVLHAYEPRYHDAFRYIGEGVSSMDVQSAGWRREYRSAMADLLLAASTQSSRYDVVLEEGRAASVILNYLRRHEPDVLVMGTRGGGKIHRALLGSVAREVSHRARCDVMLVPEGARSVSVRAPVPLDRSSRASPAAIGL